MKRYRSIFWVGITLLFLATSGGCDKDDAIFVSQRECEAAGKLWFEGTCRCMSGRQELCNYRNTVCDEEGGL